MNFISKRKEQIIYIALGVYVGAFLWFTLFNREPTYTIRVIYPFWSYGKIFQGNIDCLKENVENILLFVPAGYFLQLFRRMDWKRTVITGFCISLGLELIQLITTLGCFEFDDLLHNSIGTLIGWWIYQKVSVDAKFESKSLLRFAGIVGVVTIILFSGAGKVADYLNYQKMLPFAALSDTAEHKNLLVLDGVDGYCWNTDVEVTYQDDGSIRIKGTSDKRSWYPIGDIKLETGTYVFSGLSGVEKETVAIELEYYDRFKHKYIRLTPDVGPVDEVRFSINETTKIRAYVGVYEGCDCDVEARPVIYKEE